MAEFRFGGKTLPLGRKTYIMGILNVTPDSFSDGGLYYDIADAVRRAREIEEEGADILDIGAQSTRPGHIPVPAEEEIRRFAPLLRELHGKINIPISIDTYYPQAARAALEEGVSVINDVSGRVTAEMAGVVRESGAGWIIMHNEPPTGDTALSVHDRLAELAAQAVSLGVDKSSICLDCGIGFAKDYRQNIELIRRTAEVRPAGYAYLIGLSRKRFIGTSSGETDASQRDAGTIAADTAAIMGGADIIRVHDVRGGVQAARVADAVFRACGEE